MFFLGFFQLDSVVYKVVLLNPEAEFSTIHKRQRKKRKGRKKKKKMLQHVVTEKFFSLSLWKA